MALRMTTTVSVIRFTDVICSGSKFDWSGTRAALDLQNQAAFSRVLLAVHRIPLPVLVDTRCVGGLRRYQVAVA